MHVVRPGRNLGFGAGVNRGLAALAGVSPPPDWVLVSNPDLVVHPGASSRCAMLSRPTRPGPLSGRGSSRTPGRCIPPSAAFPSFTDAAGHALLAVFKPDNPFTKRYNPGTPDGEVVAQAGWVSGSCFLARAGV